jgi:hypothetical protein
LIRIIYCSECHKWSTLVINEKAYNNIPPEILKLYNFDINSVVEISDDWIIETLHYLNKFSSDLYIQLTTKFCSDIDKIDAEADLQQFLNDLKEDEKMFNE